MTDSGVVAAEATTPTQANQAAWDEEKTLRWFAGYEGWSDRGEQLATEAVAREMAGKRILDLGVGAGRTVPFLRAISNDYVAIDFVPQMADSARASIPTSGSRSEMRVTSAALRTTPSTSSCSHGTASMPWPTRIGP